MNFEDEKILNFSSDLRLMIEEVKISRGVLFF
jgi:hypothetical protein